MKSAATKPQKSGLAMAGGTIMSEEKNPNKNSLLKKKTDANMTQQHDPNANSKFQKFHNSLQKKTHSQLEDKQPPKISYMRREETKTKMNRTQMTMTNFITIEVS